MNEPIVIYAEATPNPSTMKFVANRLLLEDNSILEFSNPSDAAKSPLAAQLFSFPFVRSLFITANFIAITKIEGIDWNDIASELREFIRNFINSGKAIITPLPPNGGGSAHATKSTKGSELKSPFPPEADPPLAEGVKDLGTTPQTLTETERKILGVLDEFVRPAVEQDGGAIRFSRFENGKLFLLLQGACSGCPSSMVTLKSGIERMMVQMVPEVKEVVAE